MSIATNKMKRIIHLTVFGLVMLAIMAPLNAITSSTVSARAQQLASVKTGAFTDVETMLSRIFPLFNADSWLNKGNKGVDVRSSLLKLGLSNKLNVPVQEPGKTGVWFKGVITKPGIAREGRANLVLKIYDQALGGAQLYEGIHEVEVTQGQYFAIIQVPTETIAKNQTVWLEAASVEAKLEPFEQRLSFATRAPERAATNAVTAVNNVALCFTCGGGLWRTVGDFPVPTGDPTEFGVNCDGGLVRAGNPDAHGVVRPRDFRPFICHRQ